MVPRCLKIPEILLAICEELELSSDNKTLRNLSLVSRQFQDPALDVLWKLQHGFLPLLKCFPSDSWKELMPIEDDEIDLFSFTRAISGDDWKRVKINAQRIQCFILHKEHFDAFSPEFWQILATSHPSGSVLFPKLCILEIPDTDMAFHAFRLLMSPSLRVLSLSLNGHLPLRMTCLQNLAELCPCLSKLTITHYRQECAQELKPILSECKHLETLAIRPVSRKMLCWISANLAELSALEVLFTPRATNVSTGAEPVMPGGLASLQTAVFVDINFTFAPQVIKALEPAVLRRIKIHAIGGCNQPRQWGDILTELKPFSENLETMEIVESNQKEQSYDLHKTLKALQVFSNLRRLVIRPMAFLGIDDTFLQDLGKSCPKLRTLDLQSLNQLDVSQPTSPTLYGLLPLLKHCQDLTRLSLSIDASKSSIAAAKSSGVPTPAVVNMSLESLNVGYSPISSTVEVATFLASVAPKLRTISSKGDKYTGLWKQTKLHLQVVRNLRSD